MCRADNLATFICQLSRKSGSLSLLELQGPVQASAGIALPLPTQLGLMGKASDIFQEINELNAFRFFCGAELIVIYSCLLARITKAGT